MHFRENSIYASADLDVEITNNYSFTEKIEASHRLREEKNRPMAVALRLHPSPLYIILGKYCDRVTILGICCNMYTIYDIFNGGCWC